MSSKITREIALRYNRFNEARRKAGDPPIGDPLDVVGLKTDILSREPKGNGYAKKGFAKPQRRRFYDDGVPLKDNKRIAERKQREKQQAKPDPMSVEGFGSDETPTEQKEPEKQKEEPVKQTQKIASPSGFAKGGIVKKSGMAMVHEGEFVLTKEQYKTLKSLIS